MDHTEKDICRTSILHRLTKKLTDILRCMRGSFSKHIFKYLYYIKYNEIKIYHSDEQEHVFLKKMV